MQGIKVNTAFPLPTQNPAAQIRLYPHHVMAHSRVIMDIEVASNNAPLIDVYTPYHCGRVPTTGTEDMTVVSSDEIVRVTRRCHLACISAAARKVRRDLGAECVLFVGRRIIGSLHRKLTMLREPIMTRGIVSFSCERFCSVEAVEHCLSVLHVLAWSAKETHYRPFLWASSPQDSWLRWQDLV
jgi:hypothetical protein